MKIIAFLFALITVAISCSPKTTPVVEEVKTMEFPNTTVSEGYALYSSACTKCHKAKVVTNFSRDQWNKILPKMAGKAKISDQQKETIDAYINWELGK